MTNQKINTRNTVIILMILFAVVMRVVNTQVLWLSNFTPIGAMALFGGAYFNDKVKAFIVPLAALFLSDLIINGLIYHVNPFAISFWMYSCFIAITFIGTLLKKVNIVNVLLASVAGVLIHWLIMDLPPYYGIQFSFAAYAQLLIKAIPFEKNMVYGDAVYCAIFFGGFELAKTKYTFLRTRGELAL